MTWAWPAALATLLLAPAVLFVGIVAWRARRHDLAALLSVPALSALVSPGALRARGWQVALSALAAVGLALALAGPQLGFDWEQRRMEGVSIVVVLDVSRSMDAADTPPSRLELARRKLEDFTRLLQGDAVGLVLFADGAWTRIPLTTDYGTFLWAVKDSSTGTIRAQGTSLPAALGAATDMLARAPGTGKAILVVSDGEDHAPPEEQDAALARVKEAGVRIYALGIGDAAGAPIPVAEGGFKTDAAGNVVLSKLDEDRLRRLAAETGGAYVRAVVSDDDVRGIYEGEIRGKLEAAERGVRREKRPRDHYQWPLGFAAAALTLSALLGVGRRVAVVVLLLGITQAHAGAREDGERALAAEQWEEAARLLGQARVDQPQDTALAHDLATALYRAGRFREAEQMFLGAAASADSAEARAIEKYNAGNAAYRGGRLKEALDAFEAAAKEAPALAPAAANADAVRKEIQARENPPPPQEGGEQSPGESGGEGEPQPGDPSEGAPPPGDGQDAPAPQGANGQPPPEGSGEPGGDPATRPPEGASPGEPGDEPGEGTPGTEGEAAAEPGQPGGGMSAEQAARLVDSVPEGKPHVAVGGASAARDW